MSKNNGPIICDSNYAVKRNGEYLGGHIYTREAAIKKCLEEIRFFQNYGAPRIPRYEIVYLGSTPEVITAETR